MIAASDFSIFFIKPVFSKKASSPTKQGEVMAIGKPVICNSGVGDTDLIINKYHSGILINEFSDAAYDKAISEAINKKFDRTEIRNGAIDFFSLEKGVEQYADVYSKVLNAKTN
jgi:glycosyltransferase involved in cell wall biosynthesis